MPVMSILGRFLALRTTTVSLAAAGWWHTDTRSSPRPWSFSCRHNQEGLHEIFSRLAFTSPSYSGEKFRGSETAD